MHTPTKKAVSPENNSPLILTDHANRRMSQRGIRREILDGVLQFGRRRYVRGTRSFFVGRKEVKQYAREGIDLRPLENIHVLMNPQSDCVITVYRNARLQRG